MPAVTTEYLKELFSATNMDLPPDAALSVPGYCTLPAVDFTVSREVKKDKKAPVLSTIAENVRRALATRNQLKAGLILIHRQAVVPKVRQVKRHKARNSILSVSRMTGIEVVTASVPSKKRRAVPATLTSDDPHDAPAAGDMLTDEPMRHRAAPDPASSTAPLPSDPVPHGPLVAVPVSKSAANPGPMCAAPNAAPSADGLIRASNKRSSRTPKAGHTKRVPRTRTTQAPNYNHEYAKNAPD